jgi:hypothetical protein
MPRRRLCNGGPLPGSGREDIVNLLAVPSRLRSSSAPTMTTTMRAVPSNQRTASCSMVSSQRLPFAVLTCGCGLHRTPASCPTFAFSSCRLAAPVKAYRPRPRLASRRMCDCVSRPLHELANEGLRRPRCFLLVRQPLRGLCPLWVGTSRKPWSGLVQLPTCISVVSLRVAEVLEPLFGVAGHLDVQAGRPCRAGVAHDHIGNLAGTSTLSVLQGWLHIPRRRRRSGPGCLIRTPQRWGTWPGQ